MKKYIDLHCHFDGSLDLETSFELAKKAHIVDENCTLEEFSPLMRVEGEDVDLYSYLKCFELPTQILQSEQALRISMEALIANLAKLDSLYTEIRFAPQLHTRNGMSQQEVVDCLVDEVKKCEKKYDQKVNLILCMMVSSTLQSNYEENKLTIELAHRYLNNKVVALDIAGPEDLTPMNEFEGLFAYAKSFGVPFTIHAGEAGPASNVKIAMDFGASRIGHGGHSTLDEKVMQEVIEKKIPLEICATSNVDCHNQPSYKDHAIKKLYEAGAKVTINTDNRTLARTSVQKEIELLQKHCGFTKEDIDAMELNAIDAAFISETEKEELRRLYHENN